MDKREQSIAWLAGGGAGLVLCLFLFYQLYYAPKRAALGEIDKLNKQLKDNKALISRAKAIDPMWKELTEIGVSSDPASQESRASYAARTLTKK